MEAAWNPMMIWNINTRDLRLQNVKWIGMFSTKLCMTFESQRHLSVFNDWQFRNRLCREKSFREFFLSFNDKEASRKALLFHPWVCFLRFREHLPQRQELCLWGPLGQGPTRCWMFPGRAGGALGPLYGYERRASWESWVTFRAPAEGPKHQMLLELGRE